MKSILSVVTCLLLSLAAAGAAHAQEFDLVIRGGRVLDGSATPWFHADVAIDGARIVAVGDLGTARGHREIDARGLYVSPGFIDIHSHAGGGLATPELSAARPLLAQGITTVVVNPDGGGPVDLAGQKAALEKDGLGVNAAMLVPHGGVRREVMEMSDRAPNAREMDRMRELVRAGMEAGAYGLSSGPFYAPGSYSTTEELVELAKVASQFGGIYTSHVRDESDYSIGVVAAVEEVITVAREARLPGIVTHIKALGPRVWGFSSALVSRIERAREQGVEIFADQYPYEASGTGLSGALAPRWAQVGGDTALARRIDDPAERARLRTDMLENLDRRGGAERLMISRHLPDPSIEGRTLQEIATKRSMDPIDLAMQLLKAGSVGVISFNMHEDDIRTLMRQPWMITASDGGLQPMHEGTPHPRSYGTFPRKIRKYVVEERVLPLSQAIHSMTLLPANAMRIHDRGLLRPGMIADVVVFDLNRVGDLATYREPHQLSQGMVHVLVNGELAIDGERFTGALSGGVLSRRDRGSLEMTAR